MNFKSTVSLYGVTRRLMAFLLSLCVLLVPVAQLDLHAQYPPQGPPPDASYVPLDAGQLDQLVAPIALYPDALVAQVLTASTYPDQVGQADAWVQQNGGMPPDQLAAAADSMGWDPSVKALTAFPLVLDNLAKNYNWTSQLGNAYYNQPADVMNAVQALRFQAQQSGALVSTPQQRVYPSGGTIVIEPVNPGLVFVPYYNPWAFWGPGFVVAYPGYVFIPPPRGVVIGVGLGFAAGISIGLFAHYGWGFHSWAPNWRGGVVVYNRNVYYSRSVTVVNRGHFGGYNRGVFEHEAHGVPGGFHPVVTRETFAARPGPGPGPGPRGPEGRPGEARPGEVRPGERPAPGPGPTGRPTADRPADRPAPGPAGRPADRPADRPAADRPADRPAAGPADRPADRPAERPAPGPAPANRPVPAPAEHAAPPAKQAPASHPAPPKNEGGNKDKDKDKKEDHH